MGYWKNSRHNHPAYCTCVRCVNARLGRFESGRAQIIKGPLSKRRHSWLIENAGLMVIFAVIAAGFAFLWLRPSPEKTAPPTGQLPRTSAPLNSAGKATRTPTPAPKPAPTADELRAFALGLINHDRELHGLAPVELGTNTAAQQHADDMLAEDYYGHSWADGRKPYMVYTESGGDSYASENIARRWYGDISGCESRRLNCTPFDIKEFIERDQWRMMYDDAHADWGHRDNILGANHKKVNIGIAFTDYSAAFVQHFEGGAVTAIERPTMRGGMLELLASVNDPAIEIHTVISIYFDPLQPAPSKAAINETNSYCNGGGFTEDCPGRAFVIFAPAEPGYHYSDLEADEVAADVWTMDGGVLRIRARVGDLVAQPGTYTVMVFGAADEGTGSGKLLALTVDIES